MSRIFITAVFTACIVVAPPTLADGLSVAITPPLPRATLPSPELPHDSYVTFTRFTTAVAPFDEQRRPVADIVARQANISNFGSACGPSLSMTVAPNAMLAVRVRAPCLPYDAVRFEHEEMAFTVPMPMTGELVFLLPALNADAELTAILSDGTVLDAQAHVPDARDFARVALQWSSADPGELVAKAPQALDGEVVHLGQSLDADGAVLQIFSSRISDQRTSGVVRLSLRAPVTVANCGSDKVARLRRVVPGEPTSTYDLILKGSGCEAVGKSLELNNVLQDLKLVGN